MPIAATRTVTPSRSITPERRRHPRRAILRPCKVFRALTGRYTAARSCDVSDGGVLIEIESTRPFAVGELLDIGIAWAGDRQTMMREHDLQRGTIVRVADSGPDRQQVAIEYGGPETGNRQ